MTVDSAAVWLQLDLDGHLSTWWHLDQFVPHFTAGTTVNCFAAMIQNLEIFAPAKYVHKSF